MSNLQTWLTVGVILSVAFTAASIFYTQTAQQYGYSGTDVSGLSQANKILTDVNNSQQSIVGELQSPSTFGIFETALQAGGAAVDLFMNSFSLFNGMITGFIDEVPLLAGAGSYIVTGLYALVMIAILFIVLKVIFGGRI